VDLVQVPGSVVTRSQELHEQFEVHIYHNQLSVAPLTSSIRTALSII
jgi:hypothetical protein